MTQPDNPPPPEIAAFPNGFTILVRQALFTLTAFFMDGADGDRTHARAAAIELLGSYNIGSPLELQLAAECIVFACSAMETLRQAKIDPEIPAICRLRMRNSAVSLNAASHRNRLTLTTSQKLRGVVTELQEVAPEPAPASEYADNGMMPGLLEKIAQHRERVAALRAKAATAPPPFPNREQRRAAELAARREARRAQG
jgi:hypothetical protein